MKDNFFNMRARFPRQVLLLAGRVKKGVAGGVNKKIN